MDNIPCSQSTAIKELAKAFPSTRFVVRVHPNSSEHDTFEFNSLTTFDQIEVIPSSSSINSYSIITQASLVIVFASTIGVEAAYLDTPVITLSPSAYSAYDFHVRVRSVSQLISITSQVLNNDFSSFPSRAQSRQALLNFVRAFISFGETALYVDRKNYTYVRMIRNQKLTKLNPNLLSPSC